MKGLLAFLLVLAAPLLAARTPRVTLGSGETWLGDVFTMTVALDGDVLADVEYAFSQPVSERSRAAALSSVNGASSSTLRLALAPTALGECRLESLVAVTRSGERLVFSGHPAVTVRALEPDPALTLDFVCEPAALMPGDRFTLKLVLRAPALSDGSGSHSPFLGSDFFRGLVPRPPVLTFARDVPEDGPVELLAAPEWMPMEVDGGEVVWTLTAGGRARRAGTVTLPAPVLRDTRYTAEDGRLVPRRCVALGPPLTLTVSDPPLDGRPAGYVGAVATRLGAESALDTLNAGVGDPIRFTLTLRTDGDPALLRAPVLPEIDGLRPVGEPVRETLDGGGRWHYTLRPVRPGLLEIPPVPLAWYDRAAGRYATLSTDSVPLRVRPSARLVLLDDAGVSLLSALPPPLRLDFGEPFAFRPGRTAAVTLLAALLLLLLRGLARPVLRLIRTLAAACVRSPARRAAARLAAARDPAEALAALREALGRPALTAQTLRAGLPPDTPGRDAVVGAVAELERAAYTDGMDRPEARVLLARALPGLIRRLLPLVVLLLALLRPASVRGATGVPDTFLRDRAVARTCEAVTPADYADAAGLWLRLLRQGDTSESVWLNAASCAFFARDNAACSALLRAAERRYGRSADSGRLRAALAARGLPPPPAWPPAWAGSFRGRLDLFCFAAAAFCLLWALSGRRLFRLRLVFAVLLAAAAVALAADALRIASEPLPETVTAPGEVL